MMGEYPPLPPEFIVQLQARALRLHMVQRRKIIEEAQRVFEGWKRPGELG